MDIPLDLAATAIAIIAAITYNGREDHKLAREKEVLKHEQIMKYGPQLATALEDADTNKNVWCQLCDKEFETNQRGWYLCFKCRQALIERSIAVKSGGDYAAPPKPTITPPILTTAKPVFSGMPPPQPLWLRQFATSGIILPEPPKTPMPIPDDLSRQLCRTVNCACGKTALCNECIKAETATYWRQSVVASGPQGLPLPASCVECHEPLDRMLGDLCRLCFLQAKSMHVCTDCGRMRSMKFVTADQKFSCAKCSFIETFRCVRCSLTYMNPKPMFGRTLCDKCSDELDNQHRCIGP